MTMVVLHIIAIIKDVRNVQRFVFQQAVRNRSRESSLRPNNVSLGRTTRERRKSILVERSQTISFDRWDPSWNAVDGFRSWEDVEDVEDALFSVFSLIAFSPCKINYSPRNAWGDSWFRSRVAVAARKLLFYEKIKYANKHFYNLIQTRVQDCSIRILVCDENSFN